LRELLVFFVLLGLAGCGSGSAESRGGFLQAPQGGPPIVATIAPLGTCELSEGPGFELVPLDSPFVPAVPTAALEPFPLAMLQSSGGGALLADLDEDGFEDLVLTGMGGPSELRWGSPSGFGAPSPLPPAFAVSTADFDGDGDLDLLLGGHDSLELLEHAGQRTLVPAEVGLEASTGLSVAHAWADADGDGDLDLFVGALPLVGFFQIATTTQGQDRLWLWEDGAYVPSPDNPGGPGDGAALWAEFRDLDLDGQPELFVLNDIGPAVGSHLWSWADGEWTDVWEDGHLPAVGSPMGAELRDRDGDGWDDLWITNKLQDVLVQGGPLWVDQTATWGRELPSSIYDVSWSVTSLDLEGDGAPETLVTYGGLFDPAQGEPSPQADRLWTWEEGAGVRPSVVPLPSGNDIGRGSARGDFDGDGSVDIVRVALGGEATLLRSRCVGANRLVVDLRDDSSHNTRSVGARVEVDLPERSLTESILAAGPGTFSGEAPTARFAFGDEEPLAVRVYWPDGEISELEPPCLGCRITIRR